MPDPTDDRAALDRAAPERAAPERAALERSVAEQVASLSDAAQHLGRTFAAGHDLHDTDFRALSLIHVSELRGDPVTPGVLGAHLGLSSGAVTYLLDRLGRAGHVIRDRDPSDGRRVILRYADHGREVATDFFGPLGAHQHRALVGLPDADLEAATRVLRAVTGALRAYDAQITDPASTEGTGEP